MKEMYEQAVADSEGKSPKTGADDIVRSENAKLVKEKFEKGEVVQSDSEDEGRNKKTVPLTIYTVYIQYNNVYLDDEYRTK